MIKYALNRLRRRRREHDKKHSPVEHPEPHSLADAVPAAEPGKKHAKIPHHGPLAIGGDVYVPSASATNKGEDTTEAEKPAKPAKTAPSRPPRDGRGSSQPRSDGQRPPQSRDAVPSRRRPAAEGPADAGRRDETGESEPRDVPPADGQGADAAASDGAAPKKRRRRRRGGRGRGPKSATSETAAAPAADASAAETSESEPAAVAPDEWTVDDFPVPEMDGKTRFQDLDLPLPLLHAIADLKFEYCTPIQAGALPGSLCRKDTMGRAQTGTGKTAAFLLTIFTHFLRHKPSEPPVPGRPRALVLAPTRELVVQIIADAKDLAKYAGCSFMAVYGGMDYSRQQRALRKEPIDLIVATPGRLLDFQGRRDIDLGHVEILVLDEADRMLDMGFIPDVRRIVRSTPHKHKRQTMFFSATLSQQVKDLATQWTNEPETVDIEPEKVAADMVEQAVYVVTAEQKFALLYNLLKNEGDSQVLIFANRRDQTRDLANKLAKFGFNCALLNGEMPQNERMRTLEKFRTGDLQILVATDVAGRGLHVEGIGCVINFTVPYDPEDYVHRIGRTGRAGVKGKSVTFACENDSFTLPDIEELLGKPLEYLHPEPELLAAPARGSGRGGPRARDKGAKDD